MIPDPRTETWVEFDEYEDVVASTDLLAILAPRLHEQPTQWKWMIMAAQNGLQGALVCAIQNSSLTNVLDEKSAKATLKWYETLEGDMPRQRLADFKELLKNYQANYPCTITRTQYKHVLRLHREFRNTFAHYIPAGWLIEVSGLPAFMQSALDLIEGAMMRDWVQMHLGENRKCRLESNIALIRGSLRP